MGSSTNETKYDYWVCRDDEGLLHNVKVGRFYDAVGRLTQVQVSAACRPRVQQEIIAPTDSFHGSNLPPITLSNSWGKDRATLVEYRIREAPTCVRCATAPSVFASKA